MRHNRHERWPVVESLSFLEEAFFQAEEERSVNRDSIGSNEINIEQVNRNCIYVYLNFLSQLLITPYS